MGLACVTCRCLRQAEACQCVKSRKHGWMADMNNWLSKPMCVSKAHLSHRPKECSYRALKLKLWQRCAAEMGSMRSAGWLLLCLVGLCSSCSHARMGAPAPGPQPDVTAAAAAVAPAAAATQTEIRTLQPFNRVAVCAPFTVLVEPAALYQLTIDAEATVRSAITTLVDANSLLVEASSFSTNVPIKVTVGLPAGALTAVTNRGAFPGIVAPGFNASRFTINAQGTSQLTVMGLTVDKLVVGSTG